MAQNLLWQYMIVAIRGFGIARSVHFNTRAVLNRTMELEDGLEPPTC